MYEPGTVANEVMAELARERRGREAAKRGRRLGSGDLGVVVRAATRWATDEWKRRAQLLEGARRGEADAIEMLWKEFRCRLL